MSGMGRGPKGTSWTCWGTLEKIRDGSGTLRKVRDWWGTLGEVWVGSGGLRRLP